MYGFRRRGRKSVRELRSDSLAAQRMYASGMDPDDPRREAAQAFLDKQAAAIPPKRHRVVRPVDGKPPHASEHQEQAAVISWWAHAHQQYSLPEFALFAVPNGGARDAITGSRLKAEGVRRGALDLILAKPNSNFSGLFVEMKVGSNKPSEYQDAFMEYLSHAGYRCAVCWSATEAIAEIEGYLS